MLISPKSSRAGTNNRDLPIRALTPVAGISACYAQADDQGQWSSASGAI